MAIILCIESSTKNCSVALVEGRTLLDSKEEFNEKYSHAEKLTVFIQDILKESNLKTSDLSGVMVGKGPGSYTGLRIGVSVAKGLCYGLNIPLMSMTSTEVLFQQVIEDHPGFDFYIPMLDARRMEVYMSVFAPNGACLSKVESKVIDESSFSDYSNKKVLFFGDGAEKCSSLFPQEEFTFLNVSPSASAMKKTAEEKFSQESFEDTAYFEPFYLKDFIAGKPKNILGKTS